MFSSLFKKSDTLGLTIKFGIIVRQGSLYHFYSKIVYDNQYPLKFSRRNLCYTHNMEEQKSAEPKVDQANTHKSETASTASSTKPQLESNVLAALAYAIPLVMGVVVLLTEKENKFVRFHAFQSIIFGLVWYGASAIATSLYIILIGLILSPIITVAGVALWFFLMWKAYNNQEYQLPFVGKIAHDQVYR